MIQIKSLKIKLKKYYFIPKNLKIIILPVKGQAKQ